MVIEVGEKEDFAVGEGGEEGGLVDAVEGAWFEFAYSVCACYQWADLGKKEQGQEKGRGEAREGRG